MRDKGVFRHYGLEPQIRRCYVDAVSGNMRKTHESLD